MATPEPSTNCLCSTVQFIGNHASGWFFQIIGPVWGFCEKVINLDQNMAKLNGDIGYLSSQAVDKNAQLRAEDLARKMPRKEFVTWQEDVDRTKQDAEEFRQKVEGSKNNIFKRLWLAQEVQCKIDNVAKVQDKGRFPDGLLIDAPPPKGMPIPIEDFFSEVASARNCDKVRKCLMEHKFTRIGVVGMGGVGKTTIMKQIHNEMIKGTANYFDEVIWVTVSKVAKGSIIGKIQDSIAKHLYPKKDDYEKYWECRDEMERIRVLCTIFSQKRYLLLLDDVWNTFRLEQVGVSNSSNVTLVLITRSIEVSKKMGCETVQVELLTEQEARDLFMETIALDVNELSPEVKNIVETIVKKCARLPLAIMTISRNMRKEKDIDAWKEQLDQISCKEIKDEDADVLEVLRFSYDRLENEKLKLKECFLYCALYPEDYDIPRNELIEYWIMEGLIDEMDGREAMFHRGHRILNELIGANLLERGKILIRHGVKCGEYVRMHDLIREMSLKIIASNTRFIIHSGDQLEKVPVKVWSQDREKVFFTYNRIQVLHLTPLCPQLTTLLLRGNEFLDSIPDSIFSNMPRLKVLDLSYTRIRFLPKSISDLGNLHALLAGYCYGLAYVPSLEKLKELKELNLCYSLISELPEGLEELVNLRNLDLFHTRELASCDSWKLRGLSKLQRLRIDWSKVRVSAADLLCLNKLEVVCAEFWDGQELTTYLDSPQCQRLEKYRLYAESGYFYNFLDESEEIGKEVGVPETVVGRQVFPNNVETLELHRCEFNIEIGSSYIVPWKNTNDLRKFTLQACRGIELIFSTPSSSSPENCQTPLRSVEELRLFIVHDLRVLCHEVAPAGDISFRLKSLSIERCSGIENIFPAMLLQNNFPNLEELEVVNCKNVKEIIVDEDVEMSRKTITLPNLKKICLKHLPALKSIYKDTMVSTSLDEIYVVECPKLRRLPFSCSHTDDFQQHASPAPVFPRIRGEQIWWESLGWEDDHTKTAFQSSFKMIK